MEKASDQNYQESRLFGGQGGVKDEFIQPNLNLVAVRGKAGDHIDSIQILFMDVKTGNYVETPIWGGKGGG
jgi:hypothetical protein